MTIMTTAVAFAAAAVHLLGHGLLPHRVQIGCMRCLAIGCEGRVGESLLQWRRECLGRHEKARKTVQAVHGSRVSITIA